MWCPRNKRGAGCCGCLFRSDGIFVVGMCTGAPSLAGARLVFCGLQIGPGECFVARLHSWKNSSPSVGPDSRLIVLLGKQGCFVRTGKGDRFCRSPSHNATMTGGLGHAHHVKKLRHFSQRRVDS
eukprot:2243556-Rhodomonas_salina.2